MCKSETPYQLPWKPMMLRSDQIDKEQAIYFYMKKLKNVKKDATPIKRSQFLVTGYDMKCFFPCE
jgi:hypothetical protein